MRIWLLVVAFAAVAVALKPQKPMKTEQHAIGLSVGPDYITAAIATGKHETHFLLQVEGDARYKSYMRQGLWDRPYRKPRSMEPAQINEQLTTVMQAAHGKPPSVAKLRSSFNEMKAKLTKALGRDTFINIVVGVPLHLSIQARNEIHTELHDAGFRVLSTIRQPALASKLFSFHQPKMPDDLYTTLVVDYNRASLDLSVTPTAHGASDILAQQSFPNFGEDALDIKVASIMFNDTIEGRDWAPLGVLAQQIRRLRHTAFDKESSDRRIRLHKTKPFDLEGIEKNQLRPSDLDFSAFKDPSRFEFLKLVQASKVEQDHYRGLLAVVDEFVNQHSYNSDFSIGSAWNPRLSEKSNMLLSGDADESGFQAFRQVLDESDVDWPLASAKDSPIPGHVSAKGAAIEARSKMIHDENEKKANSCLEKVSQKEEHGKKVKLVVPHDL